MQYCVIGLGSMGKRRIRLLRHIDASIKIIGVDTQEGRRQEVATMFDIPVYASLEEALKVCDACLVCTSPLSHAGIIKSCLLAGKHVFTELNLVADAYDELMALAANRGVHLFLSSSMLFRKEIAYITKRCEEQSNVSYSYHVGQYLPDWHPWESYEQFFVSHQRTNGCRELFAIELPWLMEAFGAITSVQVVSAKQTNLNISYSDTYQVLLQHERGNIGMVWIDIVSRVACRELKVSSESIHMTWGGTPSTLIDFDGEQKFQPNNVSLYEEVTSDHRYAANIIENMYVDELRNYLGVLNNSEQPRYSFARDSVVLGWIDVMEGINGGVRNE